MNDLALNTSMSTSLPTMQLAWDSTSMGLLKECPRKYYLSIIEGWTSRRTSVHLLFGLYYHGALERYDHARCDGLSHDDSVDKAVDYVLQVTWDKKLRRPWISDDPNKNRFTLLRTVVWYLEQFGVNDVLKTVTLANGKPAVELSFRFDSGFQTSETEPLIICGHLDRVAEFGETIHIVDRKTSKNTVTEDFFRSFSPDNQMSTYDTAGVVVYNLPIKGIIIDAAQVAVTFSRFLRGITPRTESQREEWLEDWGMWVKMAEYFAKTGQWPMNDKSCGNYGGCVFRGICSKPKSTRDVWLKADFTKRVWDPLVARGDI